MKNFNEKALVEKLDKILRKEFGTNLSFKEFSAGYGIADLVFASDFLFSKKILNRAPLTNFYALKILLSFNDKLFGKEELLMLSNDVSERKHLVSQLNFLLKNKYLEKISDNCFKKVESVNLNQIKKIIAIEVKLTDYKNGLIQAKRYQYFADESYLAILKDAEKNIDFSEFNKSNIGLILFDTKNNSIEIKYPESQKKNSKINVYAKELMLEKFLSLTAS